MRDAGPHSEELERGSQEARAVYHDGFLFHQGQQELLRKAGVAPHTTRAAHPDISHSDLTLSTVSVHRAEQIWGNLCSS